VPLYRAYGLEARTREDVLLRDGLVRPMVRMVRAIDAP